MAQSEAPRKMAGNLLPGDSVYMNVAQTINDSPDYVWVKVLMVARANGEDVVEITVSPLSDNNLVWTFTVSADHFVNIDRFTAARGK